MRLSLYIHIPFCRRKCDYCDFYSINYERVLAKRYTEVVVGQIKDLKQKGYSFKTVYIGGGTPSVLDDDLLEAILVNLDLHNIQEATLEANPESLTVRKLRLMSDSGINRLSIGIQSFHDNILRFLGRIHDKKKALEALDSAIKCGFSNISIDLIYGVPSESLKLWEQELKFAARLPIKHISLYSLTYEHGTPLCSRLKNKEFEPISQEEEANMYSFALDYLESKRFFQYEVSNFSKRGFESKHNLACWANLPYLGIGPSAAGFNGSLRTKFIENIHQYIDKIGNRNEEALFVEKEKLTPLDRAKETAALNIRRAKGINFLEFRKHTGFDFLEIEKKTVDKLVKERLIIFKKKNSKIYGLRATRRGILFCDRLCREFL